MIHISSTYIASVAAALLLLFGSSIAHPHPDPGAVKTVFVNSIYTGCLEAGLRAGDPHKELLSFCECTVEVLTSRLSDDEWSEVIGAAILGKKPDEVPAMRSRMGEVEKCTK